MAMSGFRALRALRVALLIAAAIVVAGFVVMSLWNWLIPPLIGWHTLRFVQALGLLVLCRILFGGFRGRGAWRHRHFRHMSDQERERFRQEMRYRCGRGPQPEQPA
jgi:uncharacterized membrane protein YqjE